MVAHASDGEVNTEVLTVTQSHDNKIVQIEGTDHALKLLYGLLDMMVRWPGERTFKVVNERTGAEIVVVRIPTPEPRVVT